MQWSARSKSKNDAKSDLDKSENQTCNKSGDYSTTYEDEKQETGGSDAPALNGLAKS